MRRRMGRKKTAKEWGETRWIRVRSRWRWKTRTV